jgi:hypothetical protein
MVLLQGQQLKNCAKSADMLNDIRDNIDDV